MEPSIPRIHSKKGTPPLPVWEFYTRTAFFMTNFRHHQNITWFNLLICAGFFKKNAPPLAALFTPSSQSPLWKFIRPGTRINLCRGPKNRRKKHQATQQHSARRVATLRHGSNFVTDQHTGFGVLELQKNLDFWDTKKKKQQPPYLIQWFRDFFQKKY